MLRALLLPALSGLALHAAVIRGTVTESQTSRMLSRAVVTLRPVAGTPGEPKTVRTNNYGQFEFDSLAAGAYIIKAARKGFMSMEHGQKKWNSSGVPLAVAADSSPFIQFRLPRYAGITGTVVDENEVGLPDIEVAAYRSTPPYEFLARAMSDDRGIYRIPGLVPGTYLVRSLAARGEFLDYLPTFSRETLRVDEARVVTVHFDDDARNADVRPLPGRLFSLSGAVSPAKLPIGPVTVTLVSDMGRMSTQGLNFRFKGLPPGPYELFAEAHEDPTIGAAFQSGYSRLSIGGDTRAQVLMSLNQTNFECVPKPSDKQPLRILARRVDLAGPGSPGVLELKNNIAALPLGRWDIMIEPPAGQYVSGFSSSPQPATPRGRPDGWNEIETRSYTFVRFVLSSGPGVVHGVVKNSGETVAGVPVFLEAYDPTYRKRLMDLQALRTDMRGAFRFENLAPGTYRLLATFEYQNPGPNEMDLAEPASVRVESKGNVSADLALYELR